MNNRSSKSQDRPPSALYTCLHWLFTRIFRLLALSFRPASLVYPVALLIDGDNISSELTAPILAEAGKFGGVTIRRVYGNWATPSMQSWQQVALYYGLEQRHYEQVATGKNAADIALVVEAMDLLHSRDIRHFCLVTSDSDFTPLVRRLRTAGCIVIGIGKPPVPPSLSQACTLFVSTEQLLFPLSPKKTPANTASSKKLPNDPPLSPSPLPSASEEPGPMVPDTQLISLLMAAYKQKAGGTKNEWISIPNIGAELKKLAPTFKAKDYGKKDLPTLIQSYSTVFETRKQTTGKTRHVEVRLRQ